MELDDGKARRQDGSKGTLTGRISTCRVIELQVFPGDRAEEAAASLLRLMTSRHEAPLQVIIIIVIIMMMITKDN